MCSVLVFYTVSTIAVLTIDVRGGEENVIIDVSILCTVAVSLSTTLLALRK